jgi:N-acetylglucosaminyldiphosphoundecaprenol N-acetyl-beta-D-mannosaminyltransferase
VNLFRAYTKLHTMKTSIKPIITKPVIGFPVSCTPFDDQIECMVNWAGDRLSKIVCVANVHMLIEGYRTDLKSVLHNADLLTPDGMPLVWMLRFMGAKNPDRVAGLDILKATCKSAQQKGISVLFLGSRYHILERIRNQLKIDFPNLKVAGLEPLPFRPLTSEEDHELIQKINDSGAGIVFVSLGCPKQEYWMHQHRDRIQAVMIGLGGAFSVYAGIHKRAPLWIQNLGCEWLFRLIQEPRRLWKRYFSTIPHFMLLAFKQILADFFSKDRELMKS